MIRGTQKLLFLVEEGHWFLLMGGFWSTQYPSLRESLGAGLLDEGRLVVQTSSGKWHGGFYAEVAGLSIVEVKIFLNYAQKKIRMLIKSTLTKQNISKTALDAFVWETDIKRNKSGGDKIAKTQAFQMNQIWVITMVCFIVIWSTSE